MTLTLSPIAPALRQVLIFGRVREAITGRALNDGVLSAHYVQGPRNGDLDLTLEIKPGGWFAFQGDPARNVPDFSGGGDVTLSVRIAYADRPPVEATLTRPEAELQISATPVTVDGDILTVQSVSGAPFEINLVVPVRPVALEGVLIRDFDPEVPAVGVTVTTPGVPPVVTDLAGRFFIPALPAAETVVLSFDDGGTLADHSFQPDFADAKNTLSLSLPLASP